ncbi:MAG TPA: polysaccharide deacetylase family protein [Burkholderiaceae bacterium]|nr:polysaccharide deacetylase family protein [Burkholderiaceae bacterium]
MLIRLTLILCFLYASCFSKTVHANDLPVYLYRSPLTAQFFKVNEAAYDDMLAQWRAYLPKFGKQFKEVNRSELTEGLLPGTLILASALLLDPEEREAIQTFTKAGGGLVATWGTGSRGATGEWKGFDFIESNFQVSVKGELTRDSESWFLTPFGDGPLTWSLPSGRRIYMGKTAENLLRIEAPNLAAVYMDWDRGKDKDGANGAIAFHEADTHRAVYFSFPESAWFYHTPDEVATMLDSIMAWVQRSPKVFKAAWPDGKEAAHLIEMDTEDKFFSAPTFAQHLEKIGVKGTFYVLTSVAIKHPEIVKDLMNRGHEIAYHADVHVGFRGLKSSEQEARIINMKNELRKIIGSQATKATGFRAPTESYDTTTEQLLRKHGILHHAADPNASQDRLPFFSTAENNLGPEKALVVLPRTQHDDISFRRQNRTTAQVSEAIAHDLDLVIKGGALGLLSVHSQNYVDGALMQQTMGAYMDKVAGYKDRLWVARGDQIADWWRKRALAEIKTTQKDKKIHLEMEVKQPGNIEGLSVFVTHPAKNATVTVQPADQSAPKVRIKVIDPFRSALIFDKLAPGRVEYLITVQ